MGTNTTQAKQLLVSLFAMLLPLMASAKEVKIDGIWYNLIAETNEAEVTGGKNSGDITIPSTVTYENIEYNVTSIGSRAFDNNSLTSITIPESVTSIGGNAFTTRCRSFTAVYINSIEAWCNIDFSDYSANPLSYAHNLYLNGELVTELIIPEAVTSIGDYAFHYCSNLTSISIPESVTSIGESAFNYCSSLTSITIQKNVTSIGEGAFDDTAWYNNQPDGVVYAGSVLYKYKGTMPENTSIVVKEGTKAITSRAFDGCSRLTSINIPENVTSIGEYTFFGCSRLTSINIPESVTSIGKSAFYNCRSLESVYINSIEAWCNIDFEIIDSYYYTNPLFYAKKLYLNDVLVTDLVIPHSVTKIKDYAFYGFNGFTSITIGDGVREVKQCHFYRGEGSQLAEIALGKGLKKIEAGAFTNSENLRKITIHATQPPTNDGYIFSNATYENAMLYVPQGSISKYQTMTGWSGFYNISEIEGSTPDYLTIRQADNGEVGIAIDLGRTYKVYISPSTGWKIHSVTLDGKDMTAQLADDNTFTTPTLNTGAVLNVAYVKESSAIDNAPASRAVVRGHNGIISISGTEQGEPITIYTIDGTTVASETATAEITSVEVPTGQVYIVKVADKVVKIGM